MLLHYHYYSTPASLITAMQIAHTHNHGHSQNTEPIKSTLLAIGAADLPEDGGLGDHGGDDIGIHVGRRPPVLEVALAFLLGVAAHPHRRAAVRHALETITAAGKQ